MQDDARHYKTERERVSELDLPVHIYLLKSAERISIRTLRLFAGYIIAEISFSLFEAAKDYLSIPFASITPAEFFGGVLAGFGGVVALIIAIFLAFGPKGQSKIENNWRISQINLRRALGYDD